VSAFGTVGLSMGVPGSVLSLSGFFGTGGKWLIMFLMFMGRVGPLTLAIAWRHGAPARVRTPEGKVLIG
jgi:trk system potassium uptake protein TrkH